MTNIPNIRFKGFTDDWEQRKLGEVAGVYDGVHQTPVYQDEGIMFLSVENITTLTSEKYISEEAFERDYKVYPQKGDILMTRIGDVGTPNVVETEEKLAFYVSLALLKPNGIDSYCLNNAIQSSAFQHGLRERTLLTAIPMKINKDEIGKVAISLPSNIDEQRKIGEGFRQLDHLITFHQCKCDKTKELKKYMLQKMFPQNGKKIPEIRFEGFTDAWEQRKLGDVFEQTVEYINPKEENLELWSVTVESGLTPKTDRYNREALVKKEDKFKAVHPGDIVYNPMNMTIGSVGFNKTDKCVAVSGYYVTMRMKEGFSSSYCNTWLTTPRTRILYKLYATGSLIEKQRIQFPTLSAITTPMPSFEEQEKIGGFFVELDRTITLHQRKCDELKKIKKFMLKNMFPQKG